MSKIKYERGKTMVYPGHYPRLLVTPVFAHEGDFMWVEKIVCMYDSDLDYVEEPEFEFHRDTAHYEKNDALQAENADLRELLRDMWRFTGAACKKYPKLFDQSAQGGQMVCPNAIDAFEQRMRELGVKL